MLAEHKFQFILLDISFGPNDASGMILLPELRKAQPQSKIFMLSTHDDPHTMMRCIQAGATDFISKRDINIPNIAKIIRGFIESQGQEQQDEASGLRLATIVGARFASPSMKRVFALASLAQRNLSTPVLITGETGVSVDCGAIAESIADSELFGHVRGSSDYFAKAIVQRCVAQLPGPARHPQMCACT